MNHKKIDNIKDVKKKNPSPPSLACKIHELVVILR